MGRRLTHAAVGAACAVGAVLGLAGCATHDGGTAGFLGRAIDGAASASASGALAVGLAADGRASAALLDSALGDAIADVRTAENEVATRQVTNPDDAAAQQEALTAIADAEAALVDARAWASGAHDGGADEVVQRLADATDRLSALADEVGGP